MPSNMSRIHKINGINGQLIWTKSISNTVGFGITEIYESGRVDYIVSGGVDKFARTMDFKVKWR